MYITKTGINPHDEFKWFEGISDLDGNGGEWALYHSYEHQDKVLEIDWTKTGDEIGQITYTYVRALNDLGETENFNGSYLTYGLQDEYFDAFYTVHAYSENLSNYTDTYIEWSTTEYFGHVKAEYWFQDTDWHCWDNTGEDMDCTN